MASKAEGALTIPEYVLAAYVERARANTHPHTHPTIRTYTMEQLCRSR